MMSKISFIIFLEILCATTSLKDKRDCDGVEIVWREDWKARPIVHNKTLVLPINKVIIAHTVTTFCRTKPQCVRNVQMIQDFCMDYNGMFDISYNFLIGGDGRVYEGGGWRQVGSHTIKYNYISIGIGFIGNYNIEKPTQKVINAALSLINCGVKQGFLTPTREIHGHRDVICTESPGNNLYSVIRYWKNYKGGRISNYSCL
ncbi:peptidoglycan recognition protein [Parasteatoda tepidariorum]|uniref:peptidoglycan recognition protein n=1 Tax=Parasteatoda tepidariorum TaxID=114398 RepID=UPI001C720D3D|nr:peptidoglycan recognition protein [Parasteatoda tepidariorum]